MSCYEFLRFALILRNHHYFNQHLIQILWIIIDGFLVLAFSYLSLNNQ